MMLLNAGARGDEEESQLNIGGEDLVNEPLPSELDVRNAIKKLKCHKAAGVDGIFAEILKIHEDISWVVKWIHRVILLVWRIEKVPHDWQKAILVPLYKGKGDRSVCDSWRGISLLSVVGKVFSHILLERLVRTFDSRLSEAQAGFRKVRGCADQIFTIRRVMEQAAEKHKPIYESST